MVNWARLDDGRHVIVLNGKTRMVGGAEHFIDPEKYTEVLLEGGIQVVRKERLKAVGFGGPWEGLNGR